MTMMTRFGWTGPGEIFVPRLRLPGFQAGAIAAILLCLGEEAEILGQAINAIVGCPTTRIPLRRVSTGSKSDWSGPAHDKDNLSGFGRRGGFGAGVKDTLTALINRVTVEMFWFNLYKNLYRISSTICLWNQKVGRTMSNRSLLIGTNSSVCVMLFAIQCSSNCLPDQMFTLFFFMLMFLIL